MTDPTFICTACHLPGYDMPPCRITGVPDPQVCVRDGSEAFWKEETAEQRKAREQATYIHVSQQMFPGGTAC